MDKGADALEDRARETLTKLGYTDRPADTARGFLVLQDYIFYVLRTDHSANRWDALSNAYFPSLRFWYRTSPRDLETLGAEWRPQFGDPPMTVSGMTSVVLDVQGHLTQFTMVTPQVDEPQGTPDRMDWNRFFDAAGLDANTFKPTPSQWVPNGYADERKAWEGPMPGRPDITLRVEAAGYRGRPAFFQIVGPWTRRPREAPPGQTGRSVIRFGLFLIVFALSIGGLLLARYNIRNGRGDRRGATRIALVLIGTMFVAWVLGARHWLEPLTELGHFLEDFAASQLLNAAIMWLIYLALEPYVRRYSPEILMSWSRLLGGRFRDPRVGRDILDRHRRRGRRRARPVRAGAVAAAVRGRAAAAARHQPRFPAHAPGTRCRRCCVCRQTPCSDGMLITLSFALARMLVKRTWLAASISGILLAFVVVTEAGTEQLALNVLFAAVVSLVYVLVLVYFGMFAQMMAFLTNFILSQGGLTADFSKLYAPTSTWLLALVAGLAAFGFYASRAGEPLFGKGFDAT